MIWKVFGAVWMVMLVGYSISVVGELPEPIVYSGWLPIKMAITVGSPFVFGYLAGKGD